MPLRKFNPLYLCVTYFALHLAAHGSAFAFEVTPGVSIWYAPCGLALAFLLLMGLRYLPVVLAVNVLTSWLAHDNISWGPFLAFPLLVTANYALVAWGIRRWWGASLLPWRPQTILPLVVALLLAPVGLALVGTWLLGQMGDVAEGEFLRVAAQWWVGDASGLLTVVPPVLAFCSPRLEKRVVSADWAGRPWRRWLLLGLQTVALLGSLALVFLYEPLQPYRALYLCFPALIWIGLQHGLRGATLGTLVVTMGGLLGLHYAEPARFLVGHFLMFELAVLAVGLGLGAVVTWRWQETAERLERERKMLQTQKLESLGVLAGGVAHDFNNLLTAMLGNATLMRLDIPPQSPLIESLAEIETAAHRAAKLCQQMLAYAGVSPLRLEATDLNALLADMEALLRASRQDQCQLVLNLGKSPAWVLADANQLQQVVLNLVINAAEALGTRAGRITVGTREAEITQADFRHWSQAPHLPGGRYVLLEVRDTGPGMTAEVKAHLFEPFFTTKFTGQGLGLAATQGIVRAHGGAIGVESTEGRGTTFRIALPACAAPCFPAVAPDRA